MLITTHHTQREIVLKFFLQKVEEASNALLKWFSNNYMVASADKCHLITSTSEEMSVRIENEIIKNSLQEKLFGIEIDHRLTFEPHVENFVKKQSRNSMFQLELLITWT